MCVCGKARKILIHVYIIYTHTHIKKHTRNINTYIHNSPTHLIYTLSRRHTVSSELLLYCNSRRLTMLFNLYTYSGVCVFIYVFIGVCVCMYVRVCVSENMSICVDMYPICYDIIIYYGEFVYNVCVI